MRTIEPLREVGIVGGGNMAHFLVEQRLISSKADILVHDIDPSVRMDGVRHTSSLSEVMARTVVYNATTFPYDESIYDELMWRADNFSADDSVYVDLSSVQDLPRQRYQDIGVFDTFGLVLAHVLAGTDAPKVVKKHPPIVVTHEFGELAERLVNEEWDRRKGALIVRGYSPKDHDEEIVDHPEAIFVGAMLHGVPRGKINEELITPSMKLSYAHIKKASTHSPRLVEAIQRNPAAGLRRLQLMSSGMSLLATFARLDTVPSGSDVDPMAAKLGIRGKIDLVDGMLVDLAKVRIELTDDVGEVNAAHDLPVVDKTRQEETLAIVQTRAESHGLDQEVIDLLHTFLEGMQAIAVRRNSRLTVYEEAPAPKVESA
jgi:chorismate mutase